MLDYFGKILILCGSILILVGLAFISSKKIPFFGKLPGDIYIKKESFSFFAPIGTCLFISLIVSIVLFLISNFFK